MTGLRSLVVGLPATQAAASLSLKAAARSCPFAASMMAPTSSLCFAQSTTLRRSLVPSRASPSASLAFTRTRTDLADGAKKSADAARFKTASDLEARRPWSETPEAARPMSNPASQPPPLDWNTFFKLRMRRRRIQVVFSLLSGAGGLFVGAGLLSTGLAEPLVTQVPLDPIFTLGGLTLVFAATGWLVGPSLGNQVFYVLNRQFKTQIFQKEAQFFARIKKNRVDPANSSAANPVPDYYGEKIQSIQGYRQWLKDQRAFNKKKSANFV